MKHPPHGPETIEKLKALAQPGVSFGQAAKALGMTRNAVAGLAYRNNIKFYGKSGPGRGRPRTLGDDFVEKVRNCIESRGLTWRQTASKLKTTKGSIQYICARYKISRNKVNV